MGSLSECGGKPNEQLRKEHPRETAEQVQGVRRVCRVTLGGHWGYGWTTVDEGEGAIDMVGGSAKVKFI